MKKLTKEQDATLKFIQTSKGRFFLLIFTMVLQKDKKLTHEQLEKLHKSVEGIADAFGIDTEKMLHRIGDLNK